jgi:anti-sigma B factor antagonist
MDIEIQTVEKAIIAVVRGRVDTLSSQAFEKGLAAALHEPGKLLILDLSDLQYISSAGLRVILSAAKILKGTGGEIRLAGTAGSVKKVFQVSGFFSMFKNFETRSDALADT